MIDTSQCVLLKGLHFVKAINAIIALSLQKSKKGPWKVAGAKRCLPRFLREYGSKFSVAPARGVGAYVKKGPNAY